MVQSRRDQLQAYKFSVGRLVRAAMAGDVGTGETPLRRSGLGVTVGVALSVLLCLGAVVFGLISPAPSTGRVEVWASRAAIFSSSAGGGGPLR